MKLTSALLAGFLWASSSASNSTLETFSKYLDPQDSKCGPSQERILIELEIEQTLEALKIEEEKIRALEEQIALNEERLSLLKEGKEIIEPPTYPEQKNKSRNLGSLPFRLSDFYYLEQLHEQEIVKTSANREIIKVLEGSPVEQAQSLVFSNLYQMPDFHESFHRMQLRPKILHTMLKVEEEEKIITTEFVVIKPVGFHSRHLGDEKEPETMTKGHIVNAGILYILESGKMKLLSTTGAVLAEKNIAFDINQGGVGEDEISSIVSNPNIEEMYVIILTKKGKLLKYSLNLEKHVDPEQLLKLANVTNSTEPESDLEQLKNAKLSKAEKRRLLSEAQRGLTINFEYAFAELEEADITDLNTRIHAEHEERLTTTEQANPNFGKLLHFMAKGHTYLLFTVNDERIGLLNRKTGNLEMLDLLDLSANGPILSMERFSAFIMVVYPHVVEFIQFDNKRPVESLQKIALKDQIVRVEQDIISHRFLFVQSATQIYLYDCEALMNMQYSAVAPFSQTPKGCQFLKKVLPADNNRTISNFKTVKNSILVFFEDGGVDILYTRENLLHYQSPKAKDLSAPEIIVLDQVQEKELQALDFSAMNQAKTQQNSLFLSKIKGQASHSETLVMTQFIPLPNLAVQSSEEFSDFFKQMRTPIFFLIFIGVMLMQIYFKKKRDGDSDKKAFSMMGPLERSLAGRAPGGKGLNDSQLKEIRELDGLLGEMGNMADGMGDK